MRFLLVIMVLSGIAVSGCLGPSDGDTSSCDDAGRSISASSYGGANFQVPFDTRELAFDVTWTSGEAMRISLTPPGGPDPWVFLVSEDTPMQTERFGSPAPGGWSVDWQGGGAISMEWACKQ